MNPPSTQAPVIQFSRPVVATVRRERSVWRPEFSPVKTRMLSTITAIGFSWLSASDLRTRGERN